jgi:tRNA-splicing ligase RtcB
MKRAPIRTWTVEPLSRPCKERLDILATADDVKLIAVMPDVHVAGTSCNGIVVATEKLLYPDTVGVDIGCGMHAVRIEGDTSMLREQRTCERIWDRWTRSIAMHRRDRREGIEERQMPPVEGLSAGGLKRDALRDGLGQLGTVGGGNHFIELQQDESGFAWLMVHSGSRGMGRHIHAHHAGPRGEIPRDIMGRVVLDAESPAGRAYLQDVAWAVDYARANRKVLAREAIASIGGEFGWSIDESSEIDVPHNFVRSECHDGGNLFVHRKGAAPAMQGELSIIPGSMGTFSVHVEGKGFEASLNTSSHGAGRVLSRSAAERSISRKELARQLASVWYDPAALESMTAEAPGAYRDLRKVLEVQRDIVKVVRRVRPVLTLR